MADRAPSEDDVIQAVKAWWSAWESRDLHALELMTSQEYVELSGPHQQPRIGRETLMKAALDFSSMGRLERWKVSGPVVRVHGNVAVCSYQWEQSGLLNKRPFEQYGFATHVMVFDKGNPTFIVHHCSPLR